MKKGTLLCSIFMLLSICLNAQTKRDGTPDMRYSSNKQTYSTTYTQPSPSTTSYSNSRPIYSGQTHTTEHGGTYINQQNSQSHKGGTYINPNTNNNYGIHKTK